MSRSRDRELGLGRSIRRRDFLNGAALATAATFLAPREILGLPHEAFAPEKAPGYYPPALTGLRGSAPGTFEVAHALKDGALEMTAPFETGEEYDLVVVGAGISGLSAAHFFREAAGPAASVLLLENHDDFGGHARRNEFGAGGRLLVSYGGAQSIDSPAPYSAVARGLVADLGIDVPSWSRVLDRSVYAGLEASSFFDRETFGSDRLVRGLSRERWGDRGPRTTDPALLAQAPLSPQVRRDIQRLESEALDPWPAASSDDKKARLLRTTYADLLTRNLRLDPGVVPYYQNWPHGLFGVGIDAVSALDAWGLGFPGFQGMRLEPGFLRGMNRDTMRIPEADENYFHFPDGNATVARLLVRRLVPGAIPGSTASDVVLARANYAKLDEPGHPVRLRLNSTVVRVRHVGGPLNAREVEILYVRGGRLCRVRAKHCILACWSTVIPYLCPEMSTQQKEALAYEVKVPLVYANVLVRRWTAFRELGVSGVSCLGSYWRSFHLDFPVRVGGYECPRDPEGPIVVNFSKTPCAPGLPARDQHRAGSIELLGTSFEDMERQIRDLLDRALGPAGFDPARDVLAITANRWPHGYAYQYNALFDPFWVEGTEEPCVRARRPFGRVFVANSDADAYAYTDSAINQGHRAVQELLRSGTTTVGDGPLTPRRVARRTS